MYKILIVAWSREWHEGVARGWKVTMEVDAETKGKLALFHELQRQFGRCTGKCEGGWTFAKMEQYSNGKRYTEHKVIIAGDRVRAPLGFEFF